MQAEAGRGRMKGPGRILSPTPLLLREQQQPPPEQPPPGVRKCGYLRKHKHGHRRFFVLHAASDGAAADEAPPQPARLEYYESEKKWRSKSAAPKRSIALDSCLNIHKRADAKHKHLVALYTRDEYFALAAESEPEQEAWYVALMELLRESQPAGHGSPRSEEPPPPGASAYREVWQVTLKPRGLGQRRNLAGIHRLCLAARTVGLVRLNCERPCVTLQLMNIRRCGHSDSFFFMELGRSASTGPGELWMQADDSVVAQNIHETILEAMKALRELAEFRPRSKSQSSSSSSSSRPISVPGRRHHHPPSLTALPRSQAGFLRRSCTDTVVAGRSSGNRSRTASEGDGGRAGSLADSPSGPDVGESPLGRWHTPGAACCRLGSQTTAPPGRSLPLVHSPSSVTKLAMEPGMFSQRPSSSSTLGSPNEPASFLAFEELGPAMDPSTASNHSNTPETPPGLQLDGYIAMERGHLCYWPYIWESSGGDKVPRKRTYSLTTPAYRHPTPTFLSSASLDEYTLMRATLPTAGASSRGTYTPYPEDYCDVDIGSGGTSSSSSSHLGRSGSGEEGYMPMSSPAAAVLQLQGGPGGYMSMSPTSVSAPQQILHPHSHKNSSDNSLDDSDYMRMLGTRLSGESPDRRMTSGDYIDMSPLLLPPVHGSASPVPSPDAFASQGPRDQTSNFYNPLSARASQTHACQSQPNSLGEKKNSDQYVFMNSPVERLTLTPKGESFLAICNHTMMPSLIYYSQTESSLTPFMNEQPPTNEPPSPCGEYVNIGYSLACGSSASSLGSGLNEHNDSLIPSYMNLDFDGSQSAAVESLEDVLMPGSCPSPGQPGKYYLNIEMETTFTTATPTQPILQKPENVHVSSPVTEFKQLTLSGVQAFIFASPPDPNHGAKVIRADPQGRRRHSSETFPSTTTVTPVSPSFAHSPKRHNSASVENVSLRKNGLLEEQTSSPMCRETSAGFQNGLNHIAADVLEGDYLASGGQGKHKCKHKHSCNESVNGTYTSIDFLTHNLKEASSVKE
ncbi:insulin receptor substrate 2 [Lacerta agilis]|uniref:insulin receptor substrate 2 n=1 Tax=Lacerta agilis TaxID=80427 RepID=UPI001419BA1F|nr:insulin receptor substrate 2 [Lacerta agilis]